MGNNCMRACYTSLSVLYTFEECCSEGLFYFLNQKYRYPSKWFLLPHYCPPEPMSLLEFISPPSFSPLQPTVPQSAPHILSKSLLSTPDLKAPSSSCNLNFPSGYIIPCMLLCNGSLLPTITSQRSFVSHPSTHHSSGLKHSRRWGCMAVCHSFSKSL